MASIPEVQQNKIEKRSPTTYFGALLLNQALSNDYADVFTLTEIIYTGVTKFDLTFTVNDVDPSKYNLEDPSSIHRELVNRAIESLNSMVARGVDARNDPSLSPLFQHKDTDIIESTTLSSLPGGFRVAKLKKKKNILSLMLNMDVDLTKVQSPAATTSTPVSSQAVPSSNAADHTAVKATTPPPQQQQQQQHTQRKANPIHVASQDIAMKSIEVLCNADITLDQLKAGLELYKQQQQQQQQQQKAPSQTHDPEQATTDPQALAKFQHIYQQLTSVLHPEVVLVSNKAYTNGLHSVISKQE